MRSIVILASAWLVGGCVGEEQVGGGAELDDESASLGVERSAPGVARACGDTCRGQGTFDFHVWGERLRVWNGRRVVAAAIESHGPGVDSRIVLLSDVIRRGQFSVLCASALQENYEYPAFAAYVDVNRDGRCGPGDVGYDAQLFGWNSEVEAELSTARMWTPVTSLAPPIQRPADDFCSGYFE